MYLSRRRESFPPRLTDMIKLPSTSYRPSKVKCLSWFDKVVQQFRQAAFLVDLNEDQGATLNKKIRSAQLAQYNYIFGKN